MTSKSFVQTQAQQFNRHQLPQNFTNDTTESLRSKLTSPETINDQFNTLSLLSSTPLSSTVSLSSRPFHRQTTFSPPPNFGRSINTNHHNSQRRYSVNNQHQNAVNDNNELEHYYPLKTKSYSNDNDESSDESISIEFPPPPLEFLTLSSDGHTKNEKKNVYSLTTKQTCLPAQTAPENSFFRTVVHKSDSGSSLSNSYQSDLESSSSPVSMNQQHPSDRKTPTSRALISVSSSQTPFIRIAAGSPTRSEIRVSASPKSTSFHEIRILRPDSPSIILNRNQIGNGTAAISSGSGGRFHISVGAPNHNHYPQQQSESFLFQQPISVHGRTSSAFRHIEVPFQRENNDYQNNQHTSNLISNHLKPLFAYGNNNNTNNINTSIIDRRSPVPSQQRPVSRGATSSFTLSTLPPSTPAPSSSSVSSLSQSVPSTSLSSGQGVSMGKEAEIDQLTKILMKSMNVSNKPNFFGMCARCNDEIIGQENGLVAMDRMYHVGCFTCSMCACRLRGMHFYAMENKPYCESCYIDCQIQFATDEGCYPLNDHILCIQCNRNRMHSLSNNNQKNNSTSIINNNNNNNNNNHYHLQNDTDDL
ncbi:unnamed protein product [Didymodactylos carnosus]|uniref:LIM zinc-binding domain-containing protein n=1 Tax=Didymodactylos carnosus TaxID=1234261 RepID=A0A814CRT4_9BILA|nr:unnamed protein product [Didymodactylos carnosus]CAF3722172.1 unnamed protein product [Didymodactylos carnosus]